MCLLYGFGITLHRHPKNSIYGFGNYINPLRVNQLASFYISAALAFNGLTPINVSLNVCVKLKSLNVYIKHELWIIDSTQNLPKIFRDFGTIYLHKWKWLDKRWLITEIILVDSIILITWRIILLFIQVTFLICTK